jgi:thymidylate kinase
MRGHKGPLVFDRAFMSTLVYQGFTEGVLKDPIRYESLFALGAEAFLGDSRLGKVVGGPRIEAVFALLYCPVSVANTRITQRQEGRPDEVEMMGKEERLGHLSLLKKRYEIVMADVESRLPVLYPQVKFSFKRINTMSLAPEEVAGGLLPDLETLRGSQMELL